ncbi:MAG TPA: ammonia-forming cytochrome c nitrite reductase subunit c552 [Anaerolineales bacterium]|nr:ammonia-forming cytochrome c nitrite reductase subunit c552 [Anaerolineales bacterium]
MKSSTTIYILIGIIVILTIGIVAILLYINSQPDPTRGILPLVEIDPMEPDSEKWGVNFPNQYSTLLKTETNDERTAYGGSNPYSKLETDPRLPTLFAGYGFSKEYNEDRGHLNSLNDVEGTARVSEKTPGTCYSCKSSDNPRLWDQMGMAEYDMTPFMELGEEIDHAIGCANCHDAETMQLIVTNPALDEALQAQGQDWRAFTRQEMRTVVCANCHVEYYFKGDGNYLTFPWEDGTKIEDIANYYAELQFKDWEHPQSGAPMIKMQHPEYELFTQNSTHYNAGVACADCHMPYTRDGAAKFSTHDVKSPLLNAETACGQCHTDVTYVTNRVSTIQNQVNETMIATEDAILAAISAIEAAAAESGVDSLQLEEARQLHRESQLRWDFIAAENSMGFHNPEEALRILAAATNLARQAELRAVQAAGTPDIIQSETN